MMEQRIISLIPSGTEIVSRLGLQEQLVGRSHECDYPPGIEELPICSAPRYRSGGGSSEINRAVESILEEALSIYRIDVEKIKQLRPTHIVTQSQCRVCAVSTEELRTALDTLLKEKRAAIIDMNPRSLSSVFAGIERAAQKLEVPGRGRSLRKAMENAMQAITEKTQNLPVRPPVAHLEWLDPLMAGGHWMRELLAMAGAENCFPKEDQRWMTFDKLLQRDPEKIIIAPCGFSIDRSLEEMPTLTDHSDWPRLRAVQHEEVYISDGSHYFNRPGPRLVDSLEILAEIIHPERFEPRHKRKGWIRYEPTDTSRRSGRSARERRSLRGEQ